MERPVKPHGTGAGSSAGGSRRSSTTHRRRVTRRKAVFNRLFEEIVFVLSFRLLSFFSLLLLQLTLFLLMFFVFAFLFCHQVIIAA